MVNLLLNSLLTEKPTNRQTDRPKNIVMYRAAIEAKKTKKKNKILKTCFVWWLLVGQIVSLPRSKVNKIK